LLKLFSKQALRKNQKLDFSRSFFSFILMQDIKNKEFKRILILKPSSLGDVVRCLPILHGLREKYPNARISWLLRPDCAELLKTSTLLNEIIEFDRKYYGKIGRNLAATRSFAKFLTRIARQSFDLVLDLQGLFRSGFISFCTAAKIRMGFANAREFAPCFYTHRIVSNSRREHIVDSYWRFAHALGFGHLRKVFDLPILSSDQEYAHNLLKNNDINDNSPYFVLLPGGSSPLKRWPPQLFAALANHIEKRYDIPVVLLGYGDEEYRLASQIADQADNRVCNLVNKTSLLQSVAVLKSAALVVGNDSGPLHIAAALDIPVIGLYGPTDPAVVGPYGRRQAVIDPDPNLPRTKRYSQSQSHRIENISVDRVMADVVKVFRDSEPGNPDHD
jgi:heptosyltransferase I